MRFVISDAFIMAVFNVLTILLACCIMLVLAGNIEDEKHCKEGSTIRRECNTCVCVPGLGYSCTRKACLPKPKGGIENEKNCVEGSSIKRDCNTCKCIPGHGYACTEISCVKPKLI